MTRSAAHLLLILAGTIGTMVSTSVGQIAYQTPSQVLVDIVDAPQTPRVSLDPTHQWMLLQEVSDIPSIAELAQRELKLAGERINPNVRARSRRSHYVGLSFQHIQTGERREVKGLPQPTMINNVRWSPDGKMLSISCTISEQGTPARIEPWVIELETGEARRIADVRLNLCSSTPPRWLPDSSGLIAVLTTDKLGLEPVESPVPTGPRVESNDGKEAPTRTYQDLLKTEHDGNLFEYFFTGQVAQISIDGTVTNLGAPMMIWNLSVSPSGEYILASTIHRPFSYRVPASRFPRRIEVWDRAGKVVHQVAELPAQEEIPMAFGSVPTGPAFCHLASGRGCDARLGRGARRRRCTCRDGGARPRLRLGGSFRRHANYLSHLQHAIRRHPVGQRGLGFAERILVEGPDAANVEAATRPP